MNKQSSHSLVKIKILNVDVTNASSRDILEYIDKTLRETKEKLQIVTPNPEIIVYANKHQAFMDLLNQAQIGLADGSGVVLAGLFLGKPFKERIPGVDFMELLCQESVKRGWTVGFLGAKPGVAQKASKCLEKKYPGLNIGLVTSEWTEKENKQRLDILFVAFGFPKQEEWIADHLPQISVRLAMSVGGAFDYISGDVSRAPFIMRSVGLEWLYRLIRQPWRITRQFALVEFIWIVLKYKISKSK